jgi:predicted DNA-binding protein with PD1-like motif
MTASKSGVEIMNASGTLSMSRRCFFAAAGLTAAGAAVAAEPAADSPDLPHAELLSDGVAKTYLLVFHSGQEVMAGLRAFADKHKLSAGHVTGIGAIKSALLGYFDPEKKTYLRLRETEQLEVLSLTGNLALDNGAPFFHIHVALGRRDGSARGGHLFVATACPTVELVLTAYPKIVRRKSDPDSGAELLDI